VVGEDEVLCFHHVAEMLHGLVGGQQLSIGCTVFLLDSVEFLGEGEGLPGVFDMLLQHGTCGRRGGICDECKWHVWVRVHQWSGM
jgi:hypothetical protein